MLFPFVEGDLDYEYYKKGSEEKKSMFSHLLFSFGSSSFFDFSRKDDLISKKIRIHGMQEFHLQIK